MEAGQLLVLLSKTVEERVNYEQNRFIFSITLPDVENGRGEEQPDDRQELHCCIDGSAQIFP